METILENQDTYSTVKRNMANKIILELKTMLKRWKQQEYISISYHSFNATNSILSRAYGVPKIHKLRVPLRIIYRP